MTARSIEKEIYSQLYEALEKIDKLNAKINKMEIDFRKKEKEYKKEIVTLKTEIKDLNKTIENKDKEISELKSEILRLRTNNKKDSTNSSKPSSTNGYKKVITNNRKKSDKKPGKPAGSPSTNLSNEKLIQFINSGDVEYRIIEVNKTNKNKYMKPKIVKVMDLKIVREVREYRYYPNENGDYNIPEYHNRPIQYGENLKTICCVLNNEFYNSTDGIVKFISDITNDGIQLAKSTILNWDTELANKLQTEIAQIEDSLIEAYYLNCDDSSLKINGTGYNDLCVCNDEYTRLWISEKKDREAWKKQTILGNYKGIIVKDGTDVFNGLGIALAQCVSHINRYDKGIYDFVDHKGAIEMDNFLKNCIHIRKETKKEGRENFTKKELDQFYSTFDYILKKWTKEWKYSSAETNPVYDDERRLLCRFEDEEEREQILYFLKDFKIPATNSRAEVDQRGVKIKQKIGKFRSVLGAEIYTIIKSCILTYKKQKIGVMDAFRSAFLNKTIIA